MCTTWNTKRSRSHFAYRLSESRKRSKPERTQLPQVSPACWRAMRKITRFFCVFSATASLITLGVYSTAQEDSALVLYRFRPLTAAVQAEKPMENPPVAVPAVSL